MAAAGELAALVNNSSFAIKDFLNPDDLSVMRHKVDHRIVVHATDSNGSSINLFLPAYPRVGYFSLGKETYADTAKGYASYYTKIQEGLNKYPRLFETSDNAGGYLSITQCDSVKKRISGTFIFNAIEENTIWDSGIVHLRGSFNALPYTLQP